MSMKTYEDAVAARGQATLALEICQEEYGAIWPPYDETAFYLWEGLYWQGRYESEIDMFDTDGFDETLFDAAEEALGVAEDGLTAGIDVEQSGYSALESGDTAFAAGEYGDAAEWYIEAAMNFNAASWHYSQAVEQMYEAANRMRSFWYYCYSKFLA